MKSMTGRRYRMRRSAACPCLTFAAAITLATGPAIAQDIPCVWDRFKDATYDLRPLVRKDKAYHIFDGDDPCTRMEEPAYDYYFNICEDVPTANLPSACPSDSSTTDTTGSALQYDPRSKECKMIGEYKAANDEYMWQLFDDTDPAKGVTIKYDGSKKSLCWNGDERTFSVDVLCSNHLEPMVLSALEPEPCHYHAQIESVHGCPKECPTTARGLCDSHGHCGFDPTVRKPHCYCNEGRGGADCSRLIGAAPSAERHYSVQIGLLVTLLICIIALVGVVGFMVWQVYIYRKDAAGRYTAFQGELSRMGRDGF